MSKDFANVGLTLAIGRMVVVEHYNFVTALWPDSLQILLQWIFIQDGSEQL